MALDNVYQAGRDAWISKFQEKIFEDQLYAHVCRLQRYRQLSSEYKSTICSLQEEALRAIYRIYSLRLRPANLSETSSETLLQNQLLELIYQPYGLHDDSSNPSAVPTIEYDNSPFWDLYDWSLKLIRFLIDNGHLSAEKNKIVEDHFIKLLETIQGCRLKGQVCPSTSKNIAIIAHCLCKIFQINKPTGSTQRRLLSPGFICDHLFPLACELAAKEYPASILDPINYYARFESSGKLVEPDEALVEWNRRNKRKKNNSSKRIKFGYEYNDLKEDDVDPLPPAHVCLEHLIYELTVSSNQADQGVIVEFLRKNVLGTRDQPNGDSIDSSGTGSEDLMNKIVALHVFGRLKLLPTLGVEEISFLKEFVLPNLKHDPLLLKICKFQLVRFLRTDDFEQRITLHCKLAKAFLDEFIKVMQIEDYQDPRNKLFIVFASVASECLYKLQGSDGERLKSLFHNYLEPDDESKLILVKKITNLYLDYKIVAPLALVDIMYGIGEQSKQFYDNIERAMTKVIDSIAAELLAISPHSDRAQNLSEHLYTATNLREKFLPAATADRLVKLAKISSNDVHRRAFLECALMNPLEEPTELLATEMLDRFLQHLPADDTRTMKEVTIILGNFAYHQATSSTLALTTRNPLIESHGRMRDILAWCELIERETDLTSSWVMSILMDWPVIKPPSTVSRTEQIWHCFVDFAIRRSDQFNLRKTLITSKRLIKNDDGKKYVTCQNLLFAIMAAMNYDLERLEDYLNYIIRPTGRGQSTILVHMELWLDFVNGFEDGDDYTRPDCIDVCFMQRSHVVISHEALINIHLAHTAGELGFPIEKLTPKLNSARQRVLNWLVDKRQHTIETESPLRKFYDRSIQQLRAIGSYE